MTLLQVLGSVLWMTFVNILPVVSVAIIVIFFFFRGINACMDGYKDNCGKVWSALATIVVTLMIGATVLIWLYENKIDTSSYSTFKNSYSAYKVANTPKPQPVVLEETK